MRSPEFLMTYYSQLHPWRIICRLPNAWTLIVARLRRRNDAEARLRILRQLTPTATYHVIFDGTDEGLEKDDLPPHS